MTKPFEKTSAKLPSDFTMNLVFFLLCLIPLVLSFFINAGDGHVFSNFEFFGLKFQMRGVCFFKLTTGYNCPVCGMTRCFSMMSHGRFLDAYMMSHAGVAVYSLAVFETFYRALRMIIGKKAAPKAVRIIETALISFTCIAVAFCFVIQFIYPDIL